MHYRFPLKLSIIFDSGSFISKYTKDVNIPYICQLLYSRGVSFVKNVNTYFRQNAKQEKVFLYTLIIFYHLLSRHNSFEYIHLNWLYAYLIKIWACFWVSLHDVQNKTELSFAWHFSDLHKTVLVIHLNVNFNDNVEDFFL